MGRRLPTASQIRAALVENITFLIETPNTRVAWCLSGARVVSGIEATPASTRKTLRRVKSAI